MDDFSFMKNHKRGIVEPNIVPVIDMLTVVIFFLLLSTVFVGLTRLSIPPSLVQKTDSPQVLLPLNPKLILSQSGFMFRVQIVWKGSSPGNLSDSFSMSKDEQVINETIERKVSQIMTSFLSRFPNEKSIQVGISGSLPYQYLISAIDGTIKLTRDIVLMSDTDVARELEGIN